jgi:predicted metal-dependent peptidase
MAAEQIYNQLPDSPDGQGADPGGCGGVEEPKDGQSAMTESDMQREAAEWRVAVQQAAAAAKVMGKLPGSIARMVDEVVKPKLDWRDILHSFMQRVKQDNYTWKRPNRRFIGDDLYLPSLDGVELKPIIITIDTSGSLADEDLAQFQAEINAILDSVKAEIKVIYCDSKVHKVETFTEDQRPIKLENIGGGGTDFRPPFQWVEDQDEPVTCMLYFSDLMCHRFPPEPDYPVLWIATDKGIDPPFGEVAPLY